MHNPPRILIVDDNETNRDILVTRLGVHGYELLQAADGEEALVAAKQHLPDLILLDVMMPKLDGIEVTKRIKADKSMPFTPIILVTAKADSKDIVAGLDAGADEYLTKPVDQISLVARVKSVLRIKELHDQVNDWNKSLEQRVSDQVGELERVGRLKRFLAPQVAELLVTSGDDVIKSHRRDISVVFCDLRGFTAFAETAEPEEVMGVLGEYHACLGALIHKHEGTLDKFAGDGLMVLVQRPGQMRPAGAAGGPHGGRDARRHRAACGQMAQVRAPARFRPGHRARLCHHRPDRLRGPLRLFRHRFGGEPGVAAVRRSAGRADPGRAEGVSPRSKRWRTQRRSAN